jgi:hypothetical protein
VNEAAFGAEDSAIYQRLINELILATRDWECVAHVNFKHIAAEDDDCLPGNPNIDIAVSTAS